MLSTTSSSRGQNLMESSDTGYQAGDDCRIPAVMIDFEALLVKVYGPARAEGHLTASKDLKGSLSDPISTLPTNARRRDVSYAASLFMARKALPSAVDHKQLLTDYVSKMGRDQTPNAAFVAWIDLNVESLFPVGWDSKYVAYCGRALPTAGASFGNGRKNGGSRGEIVASMSRNDFIYACRTGEGVRIGPDRKVSLVDDNGKTRIVTIADASQHVLAPLHHLIYDNLSGMPWLLKGEATANSFKEFKRIKGEVFVSGDYEAATDNFNVHHSRALLAAIFRVSPNIPKAIQELALSSLTGNIVVNGVTFPQIAGQLMGNLLSFPLLCLMNYMAFTYAIRRSVPLRINGDDIVFRATPEEAQRWMDVVVDSGLTLSKGKTLLYERYFSLNSTFFEARTMRKPSLVPIIRAKCIYAPLIKGDGLSLAARLHDSCNGMSAREKQVIKGHILKFHAKAAREMGCSMNRALGVRVAHDALVESGFLEQESFYLMLERGLDKPREMKRDKTNSEFIPPTVGWKEVPVAQLAHVPVEIMRILKGLWGEHCVEHAWRSENIPGGLNYALEPPTVCFRKLDDHGRKARLMGTTRRGLARLLSSYRRHNDRVMRWLYNKVSRRRTPDTLWLPAGFAMHYRAPPFAHVFRPT
jgi:hypothetical protein